MSGGFNLDDYVDVAERIRLFYKSWPDGRLYTSDYGVMDVGDRQFAYCRALAYRTPDDPTPCSGTAWEPIPGPTPYTRDSELMNAETAAWGRAIIAAGIPSKKIASADEVQARRAPAAQPVTRSNGQAKVTKEQHAKIGVLVKSLSTLEPHTDWVEYSRSWAMENYGKSSRADLLKNEAHVLIDHLEALEKERKAA